MAYGRISIVFGRYNGTHLPNFIWVIIAASYLFNTLLNEPQSVFYIFFIIMRVGSGLDKDTYAAVVLLTLVTKTILDILYLTCYHYSLVKTISEIMNGNYAVDKNWESFIPMR